MKTSRTNAIPVKRNHIVVNARCALCSTNLDMIEALKGSTEKYWCPLHEKRGRLLNRAAELGYPAICFTGAVVRHPPVQGLPDYIGPTKYAIGIEGDTVNKALWLINAVCGSDDLIEGALRYIEGQRGSEEGTI